MARLLPEPAELAVPVAGGSLNIARLRGAGPPSGPAVLAVHGITANSRAWLAVARELGPRAELIAVDLRGRGGSRELPAPYGFDAHEADLLATLDTLGLERAVLVGHSLGAYIVAHLARRHPERVRAVALLDGGLALPGFEGADPRLVASAGLGPALARFSLRFPSREAYVEWWLEHPALARGQVERGVLAAYAGHDLIGAEPQLAPAICAPAVEADMVDLAAAGAAALALSVPARLLVAPRGLMNDPVPLQPLERARAWAAADASRRRAELVPDVNHYTLVMGRAGAQRAAGAIVELLEPEPAVEA